MIKKYREKHFVTGYGPQIVLEFSFFFFSSLGSNSNVMSLLESAGIRLKLTDLHTHTELPGWWYF